MIDRLRRPEYTGENRCWPCTVVNLVLLFFAVVATGRNRPGLGAALGAVGGLLIWVRGYVVPYTPRFAPRLVAALPGDRFGHDTPSDTLGDLDPDEGDGEAILRSLVAADVVVATEDRLAPTDEFATAWRERMEHLGDAPDERLAEVAREASEAITSARIEDTGSETFLVVSGDDGASWLRRPVAIAEVAALQALGETGFPAADRELGAHAVCAFLETCPACGDDVAEASLDDCCGHTVPDAGTDPPQVLACETCGVAFYQFE
ncbi:hypothetical protein [Halobellus ordinarius]|uniref:hypothetical protein n=1 Tax=Halobellus ordinarius TaxID=3075120 RepID=UPI0028809CD4|nr:hypothetical protein [Halobellus sp. ZY16]